MGVAVLTILVSVLTGTLLAFLPRQHAGWMGPMRTFGLAAALSVVVLHMMPESVEAIGGWAVPALAMGLALPALLGWLGSFVWRAGHAARDPRHVKLEAGYAGLLVHKVGDGLALGVYAGEIHPGGAGHGFAAALAAHIVPVVAIVVLTFDSVRGRGSALLRAIGLALAGLLGVFLTRSVAVAEVSAAQGWVSALAAGMLLHVVLHDLSLDLPKSVAGRSLDFVLAGLGLCVSALGGDPHGAEEGPSPSAALLAVARELGAVVGPALIAGVLLWLVIYRSRLAVHASRRLHGMLEVLGSTFALETSLIIGLLVGADVGVLHLACSCGWAALLNPVAAHPRAPADPPRSVEAPPSSWLVAFDARLLTASAWAVLGVFLAALLGISVGEHLVTLHPTSRWMWSSLVALAAYVCAPVGAPVAAVLVAHGLSPGVALVGLLVGPCLRHGVKPALAGVSQRPTRAGAWLASAFLVLFPGGLASVTGPLSLVPPFERELAAGPDSTGVWWIAWALTAVLVGRVVFRSGFRGFLLQLAAPLGQLRGGGGAHHGHAHMGALEVEEGLLDRAEP